MIDLQNQTPTPDTAQDLGHLIRHQHCLQFLVTHKPSTLQYSVVGLLICDIAYIIFTYSALNYSRTSVGWYASAGPQFKTCWWSFLSSKWQLTNVSSSKLPVAEFWCDVVGCNWCETSSNLFCFSVFCRCIFTALAASVNPAKVILVDCTQTNQCMHW